MVEAVVVVVVDPAAGAAADNAPAVGVVVNVPAADVVVAVGALRKASMMFMSFSWSL